MQMRRAMIVCAALVLVAGVSACAKKTPPVARPTSPPPATPTTANRPPAPYNEIAYAARSGGGYDIRLYNFSSGETVQLTNGIGSNESPAFSPNGRHIAFTSTRAGREQIFTIARDGKDLRQITREGVNRYPNWSQSPQ